MMKSVQRWCVCVAIGLGLASATTSAQKPSPAIVSAVISVDSQYLIVEGTSFGSSPVVTLGGIALGGVVTNGTHLEALMPALTPGAYQLTVTSGNNRSSSFEITIGAQGPAGAAGSAGPAGPTGPAGATGAQGPQGPVGGQGPGGPTGPSGASGSTIVATGMVSPSAQSAFQPSQFVYDAADAGFTPAVNVRCSVSAVANWPVSNVGPILQPVLSIAIQRNGVDSSDGTLGSAFPPIAAINIMVSSLERSRWIDVDAGTLTRFGLGLTSISGGWSGRTLSSSIQYVCFTR
jgi:hypothetical protein